MKRNLLTLLIILLSVIYGGNNLSAQETESGTWGGIDWTLTTDGTLTIAPTVNEITKVKPYSETNPKELYQVGEWPAAVNDAINAITGWPYDRTKVKKLIIEEGVTSIGSFAAQSFTNLTGEVVIPSTVTYIGQEAFQKSYMTKLTFASGGTGELCIAPGAFKSINITELELPGDRREVHIHSWAFNDCPNLTTVIIPANVSFGGQTHLEYCGMDAVYSGDSQVFKGCSKLKNIYFASQEVKDAFFNAPYNGSNMTSMGVTTEVAVAKVNSTFYATIDDAVEYWTNGTTLTLLANVTLSDVIKLKSTENHTLNLGTYKMTAATGKNAIEITCEGRDKASYALTVNANNTGGITATGQSCIYYTQVNSIKDRPMITINGGEYRGSYSIYCSSSGNTNCPQYIINGGIFYGDVNLNKALVKFNGGLFHCNLNCKGGSSDYRQITGGTFKNWQWMTADAANKFWVGAGNGNYNVGLYVNEENYLVVGGPVITDYSETLPCNTSNYSAWSSYLKYSSAATYGLYYKDIELALNKNNSSSKTVNIHTGRLELTSSYTYNGTICLPKENSQFTVVFPKGKEPNFVKGVTTSIDGASVVSSDVEDGNGNVVRVYSLQDVARVNDVHYKTFKTAFGQASDGNTVYIIVDNVTSQGFELNKNVTIDFKNFKYTATSKFTIPAGKNVTLNNGTLNGSGFVISTSGNLTMQDMTINGTVEYLGGEMFTDKSFKVSAKKDFIGVGTDHTQNWSTISTPIANADIPATAGIHDLYRFDEPEQEWEYYNDADGLTFKKLELGRGYLYANAENITFELTGNLNIGSVEFPLSYTDVNSLAGFHMIGNPFTHTISKSNLSISESNLPTSETLADGFYVVGTNGQWTAFLAGIPKDQIAPMESVLIQTYAAAKLTIAPSTPNTGSKRAARNENSYLTINVASKTHSDVAYVSFNDGMGLDKINHRNPDNPMLYIPVEGKNYAIAMMDKDVKEVPVYFNANRMAEYTISIEQKNCEFNTMTLVDKLTGIETNMLIEDYTFMARTFDDANRFVIRLSIEDNDDSETENFAYVSNGSIVIEKIEGNANIRIFDIMGRHIMGTNATGNANIPVETMSTGMYIIQMADDNGVKVQKIIIE